MYSIPGTVARRGRLTAPTPGAKLPIVMDDQIIDLTSYGAPGDDEGGTFALWGSEGERSRFALPVWRCIFLLDGDRGGIVSTGPEGRMGEVEPFFVLDLGNEPARTGFDPAVLDLVAGEEPPALGTREGAGVVLLARDEGRRWWLVVTGPEVGRETLESGEREDLLFLAGECAGLLTHRGLADG